LDRSVENETISYLTRRGHFGFFVFEELDKSRATYDEVTKRDFIDNFVVSDDIVVRFQNFVNQRERTNITFVAYNEIIKTLIKANLGRQLYDDNTYYEILNGADLMVEEVLLLSEEEPGF
jgi:carboxyl-terminal processing protease